MADPIKYCSACVHFVRHRTDLALSGCNIPRLAGDGEKYIDPSLKPMPRYCRSERANSGPDSCGPEGRWFERAWEIEPGFFPADGPHDRVERRGGVWRVYYNRGLRFETFDIEAKALELLKRLQEEGGAH